jgi:Transmembrane secretion effector
MTSHDATPGPGAGTHPDGPVNKPGHEAKAGLASAAAHAFQRERAPGSASPAGAASPPQRHSPPPRHSLLGVASPPHRHRRRGGQRSQTCELFAVREFGGLWCAQVLSTAGDQFAQIAVAVGVYERTRSPFLTALVYAMSYLPQVIGGPLLAEVASLVPRRTLMIGLNLTRAALVAVMALSGVPFAARCALLVTIVMLGASFSDARASMLPDVLPPGQIAAGTEIGSVGGRAGQLAGFLAGGALVAAVQPRGIILLAAAAFVASAGIISGLLARRPVPPRRRAGRPLALPVTRAEAAAVVRQPLPRTLLLLGWLSSCAIVPEALAAPYAHVLHGGMIAAGLLMTAIPAGALTGAVTLTFLARPSARLRIMSGLAVVSCAPLAASSLHPPLWAVLVLWAAAGAAGAYQLAAAAAFVRALPAEDLASAVDLAQAGLIVAQGAGLLAAGLAAQLVGPQAAVTMTGLLGVAVAATLAGTWRRLRSPG